MASNKVHGSIKTRRILIGEVLLELCPFLEEEVFNDKHFEQRICSLVWSYITRVWCRVFIKVLFRFHESFYFCWLSWLCCVTAGCAVLLLSVLCYFCFSFPTAVAATSSFL